MTTIEEAFAVGSDPFERSAPLETIATGIHLGTTIGHVVSIETSNGIVQIDTGHTRARAREVIGDLRALTDAPVRTILYSHGHLGYNNACPEWLDDAERRGDPRPSIVAHENLVRRYRRYEETSDLQQRFIEMQFRAPKGSLVGRRLQLTYPEQTFATSLVLHSDDRPLHVMWAPSETDDALAVWLPIERILYGGAATVPALPNVGTPLRTLRDPVRWAETIERFADLRAELLIREHGRPLEGEERIREFLLTSAAALRWIRRETVTRMNQGMTAAEILQDIEYPSELFDLPWLTPGYGHPDYIVRDVYRSENGWWEDRNATSLHPEAPDRAAAAVLSAIGDRDSVLARARALRDAGDLQLALHVVDLLALAPVEDPSVSAARKLKAELCRLLGDMHSSFVSRSLYQWAADELDPPAG